MRAGRATVGFQQFIPSPALTEMAAIAGFDWVWLCIEHGSAAIGTELENLIRTAEGVGLTPIVRVTHNEYSTVMRCLELGAKGVLVPRVRTPSDVEQAVEWVKYPPQGSRGMCTLTRAYGYGAREFVPEDVNEETIVMLIIEQMEAIERLDDILLVPGVDCAIFGAGDLSLELGLWQRVSHGDPEALEVLHGYRRRFIEACRRHRVAAGDLISDAAKTPSMLAEGVTVFASSADTALIQGALASLVQQFRRMSMEVQSKAQL